MTKSKIKSIIELTNSGWRVYSAALQDIVYTRLNCPYAPEKDENGRKKRKNKEPFWFVRSEHFLCIGCNKACSLFRPEGFIPALPINYEEKPEGVFALSPAEMVQRRALLRVDEAAYCLNIKERTIYDWLAEGKLRKTKDNPIRIPAEDVAFQMNNFED